MLEHLKTEMDVREVVIRPLLEKLGYSPAMVITERPLIYNRFFLGGKKPKTDRPLRGRADYICEASPRLRWVIEAKAPGEITDDEREQAYSYAVHAEIRAVLFCVISATHFEVYQTLATPETALLLSFTWEERDKMFDSLANIVSPAAIKRDFKEYVIDSGVALAPGLRSYVSSLHGKQTYTAAPEYLGVIIGTSVVITGGTIVRGVAGGIMMRLIPTHVTKAISDFANTMGISEVLFFTEAEALSTDPTKPTVFVSNKEFAFKEGMPVPSLTFFNATFPAPLTMNSKASAELIGFVDGNVFHGAIVAHAVNPEYGPFEIRADIELTLN
jgi:hypothetical protein